MRVIGQAERYVKENQITKGQIWCVYDKDSFPAQNFNGVVTRAESLNKENPSISFRKFVNWTNFCIIIRSTGTESWKAIRNLTLTDCMAMC